MTIRKGAVIDFRTILLLDLLYMLFFLLSGKPEVVVAAFLLSGTFLFLTELYVAMIRYAVLFVALFFITTQLQTCGYLSCREHFFPCSAWRLLLSRGYFLSSCWRL